MNEEQNQQQPTNDEVDPILTNDLTDVSPDQPLVPKNTYPMEVKKIELTRAESSGNRMIVIQLANVEPITSVKGEVLPAGTFNLFHRIVTTPGPKLTQPNIERAIKRFQLSCGVRSGAFMPVQQYIGKCPRAQVGFSKRTEEYPDERNEVKGFELPS